MASENMTGVFQGAIIIRSAILRALRELREDPNLIRDALASLPQDDLTADRYGEKTITQCVEWFTKTKVPVKLGLALSQLTSPVISVEMNNGDEAEATLGDVDYNVSEADPWTPGAHRQLASVHAREGYNVIMMVKGEPEYLLFLSSLVLFGLLRHKEDLLDDRGFARLTWNRGVFGALPDVPGRENFFACTLKLNGFCRHTWPVPVPEGQPTGTIESTEFGPRCAPPNAAAQTPTDPGPTGANPFDPANWADRDVLGGDVGPSAPVPDVFVEDDEGTVVDDEDHPVET